MEHDGFDDDADAAQQKQGDGALLQPFFPHPGTQGPGKGHGKGRRRHGRRAEQQHLPGDEAAGDRR